MITYYCEGDEMLYNYEKAKNSKKEREIAVSRLNNAKELALIEIAEFESKLRYLGYITELSQIYPVLDRVRFQLRKQFQTRK